MAIFDISKYRKDKEENIEDFERDTGIEVIDHDIDSLDELEDEFDDFQQMTYKQRKISNAKSEELYGMNNYERYDKLKSDLLKKEKNTKDYTIYTGESAIIDKREENVPVRNSEEEVRAEEQYQAAIVVAKDWSDKSMMFIITPQDTMIQLEELWNKWNQMHLKHRRDSDMKSIELFNMTNKDHYEKLKSTFLKLGQGIVEKEKEEPIISSNDEKIIDAKENIEAHLEKGDILSASKELLKLKSINTNSIYETKMIENIEKKFIKESNLSVNSYYDRLNDLPYFTPEQIENMGVYFKDTFYNAYADNKYLDDEETITTKDWFDCYNRTINGFLNENFNKYTSLWINKLNNLYKDFESIKESGNMNMINSRKQSILELGWNPEIDFNLNNRKKASDKTKEYIKSSVNNRVLDIKEFYNNCEELNIVNENNFEQNKYPLFVVLSYSGKGFSKIISKYTKSKFSHASLGLEPELDKLYSYNLSPTGGFVVESLDNYRKTNSNSHIAVFCTFLDKEQIRKVRLSIDQLLSVKDNTKYSFKNILGIGLNVEFESNISMICSQFVDRVLKMVNIDHTGKPSGLVTPNDLYINKSRDMYLIYDGPILDYNPNKARMLMKKLNKNSAYIKESAISVINEASFLENMNLDSLDTLISIDKHSEVLSESNRYIYNEYVKPYINIYYYNEAKEFPIQFDKEGNLLIKNMKRLNYEAEYNKSHKLLLNYNDSNNMEGMKYELCKLWFLNTIIEGKIYNEKISDNDKASLYKTRARILNDFNKYMKVVLSNDKEFNFTDYYNQSPFSDVTVKISKHTLKHGINLAKLMISNTLV